MVVVEAAVNSLIDHEKLQPRLRTLVKAHEEDMDLAANLEHRIGSLLRRYAIEVCVLNVRVFILQPFLRLMH